MRTTGNGLMTRRERAVSCRTAPFVGTGVGAAAATSKVGAGVGATVATGVGVGVGVGAGVGVATGAVTAGGLALTRDTVSQSLLLLRQRT